MTVYNWNFYTPPDPRGYNHNDVMILPDGSRWILSQGEGWTRTFLNIDPTTGSVVGLVGPDGVTVQPFQGQSSYPAKNGIDELVIAASRPVQSGGKMLCRFKASEWTAQGGATLADHSGFDANGVITGVVPRSGIPTMLKITSASDSGQGVSANGTALNTILPSGKRLVNGWFGLLVYVETQPGFQPGGTLAGTLLVQLSTNTSTGNGVYFSFNTNQSKEGWNFLVFRMRNTAAYVSGSGQSEFHPFGMTVGSYGTGATSDVVNNDIQRIDVLYSGTGITGTNIYLDSLWTDLNMQSQFVIGFDSSHSSVINYALPAFNERGWKGYATINANYWNGSSSRIWYDYSGTFPNHRILYNAGWEIVNHGLQHLPGDVATPKMGTLTDAGEILYEVVALDAIQRGNGFLRGAEFYVSPHSSTSRLAEKVIAEAGFKLQRHARKHNNYVLPWGIENPRHLGAAEIGYTGGGVAQTTGGVASTVTGTETITKLRRWVDVMIDYQASAFPFSHEIQTSGDDGAGGVTPSANNIMRSTFELFATYVAEKEAAGLCRVRDGFSGFYYGTGR